MGLPAAAAGCGREPEAKAPEVATIPTSTATPTPTSTPTASPTATPTAKPEAPTPLPNAWTVSYPLPPPTQPWCTTGTAECALSRDVPQRTESGASASMGCPSLIDVPCPCSPAHPMGCNRTGCTAPFTAQVTQQERAKKSTACCYELPRTCVPPFVGRLLRVREQAITAGTEERADWRVEDGANVASIGEEERVALANHWRQAAAAEHASIASFARVSLQLMALGAPSDLVASVHAAALDEVEHARLTFSLASSYSGFDEGPGALPVEALDVQPLELHALALATFLDACVGETVGTVVAKESAERARDPRVRAVLETIARDEERHAALAWRTLAWAVRAGGERVHHALAEALLRIDEALAPVAARPLDLSAHGVLGSDQEEAVRRRAVEEIVVPCARALIESRAASRRPHPERLP